MIHFKSKVNYPNDFNTINNNLEILGLYAFQHRLIIKLCCFSYKILKNPESPLPLKTQLIVNESLNKPYNLRNSNKFYTPGSLGFNSFGELTFSFFFSKFINSFTLKDLDLNLSLFRQRKINNVNLHFIEFIKMFPKFDIDYIHNFLNYVKYKKNNNLK